MQLRLRSHAEVRLFSIGITAVALVGNLILLRFLLPYDIYLQMRFPGSLIAIILAAPISYYVGLQILSIHILTAELEHTANHDNLTGTCTRLRFYERVAKLGPAPLSVVVCDIDYFKSFNDEYGHKIGDAALKKFASTLIRNCREDDIVARFGGEEFVVLLYDTDLKDGILTAQRLCQCVREKPLILNGKAVQITASFGVAPVLSTDQIDTAIHNADRAVYRAKDGGRDQVCIYDPEIDTEMDNCAAE